MNVSLRIIADLLLCLAAEIAIGKERDVTNSAFLNESEIARGYIKVYTYTMRTLKIIWEEEE